MSFSQLGVSAIAIWRTVSQNRDRNKLVTENSFRKWPKIKLSRSLASPPCEVQPKHRGVVSEFWWVVCVIVKTYYCTFLFLSLSPSPSLFLTDSFAAYLISSSSIAVIFIFKSGMHFWYWLLRVKRFCSCQKQKKSLAETACFISITVVQWQRETISRFNDFICDSFQLHRREQLRWAVCVCVHVCVSGFHRK